MLFCLAFASVYANGGFMSSSFAEYSTGNKDFKDDSYIFTSNDYKMDGQFLTGKSYRSTEEALHYLPFVKIINTGFNALPDLRAQGERGTKLYINGILANNSIYQNEGFAVINTILPSMIESIDIKAGASSVLYGSGAKSGVIEIQTTTRQAKPRFTIAYGFDSIAQGGRNSQRADASYRDKFGDLFVNLGIANSSLSGQRLKDSANLLNAKLGLAYDFNKYSNLNLNVDFYQGKAKWESFNSFYPKEKMIERINANLEPINLVIAFYNHPAYTPSKEDRNKPSSQVFDPPSFNQNRLATSAGYEDYLAKWLKFKLSGFYFTNTTKYNDTLTGFDAHTYKSIPVKNVEYNLGGTAFSEVKFGGEAKFEFAHKGGKFTLGAQSIYEKSEHIVKRTAKTPRFYNGTNTTYRFREMGYKVDASTQGIKNSNAIYALERFSPFSWFAFEAGVRYDTTSITSEVEEFNQVEGRYYRANGTLSSSSIGKFAPPAYKASKSYKNLAFELMPSLRYSNSGLLYAKFERGFTTLPADFLIKRVAYDVDKTPAGGADVIQYRYEDTNLDNEVYDSFEVGFKDFFAGKYATFLFSANAFLVETQNEFYSTRNYNPIVEYKGTTSFNKSYTTNLDIYATYKKTKRTGYELALEQYFFEGKLGLNQSLNFIKAHYEEADKWLQIPYTYTYKANFGANWQVLDYLSIWTQNAFFGVQRSIFKDVDKDDKYMSKVIIQESEQEFYLDKFFIIDVGVSVSYKSKFGSAMISAGVRNISDTFYYDYHNLNKLDTISGYGYVLGNGRTYFIEGRYFY